MRRFTTARSRVSAPDGTDGSEGTNGSGGTAVAASAANGSSPTLGTAPHAGASPRPRLPKRAVCPICATTFEPRASGGQCPVCGEQVVPVAAATRHMAGISPAAHWLADGGWRLTLVLLLVAYELGLFIFVWIQLAQKHLL